jgi:serine 3-dehydrogenase
MSDFKEKTVFITGASSGIGEACAHRFAQAGARVLLCARRMNKLEQVAKDLAIMYNSPCHTFELDVTDRTMVDQTLNNLPSEWQEIDMLINNAGLARGLSPLQEGSIDDWEEMIDTNIKGLLYVTRKLVPGMIDRNRGDIINIGSLAGHEVYPKGNVYCGTKHAVDAITRGLRMDLLGTNIRVCTVDPGLVETEFSIVRFHGSKEKADNVYSGLKPLTAADIADAVHYCASRPQHVQIAEMIILASAQRSSMHVHRE